MPRAAIAAVATSQAIGVTHGTACPESAAPGQTSIVVGRNGSTGNGARLVTTGNSAKSATPIAMAAGWPGTNAPAARPTALKNATVATIPIASPTTSPSGGTP